MSYGVFAFASTPRAGAIGIIFLLLGAALPARAGEPLEVQRAIRNVELANQLASRDSMAYRRAIQALQIAIDARRRLIDSDKRLTPTRRTQLHGFLNRASERLAAADILLAGAHRASGWSEAFRIWAQRALDLRDLPRARALARNAAHLGLNAVEFHRQVSNSTLRASQLVRDALERRERPSEADPCADLCATLNEAGVMLDETEATSAEAASSFQEALLSLDGLDFPEVTLDSR